MGDIMVVMEEEGLAKIDTGALVPIDSIAIDFSSSMESPKVEQFSIRGFVADMRKRDWKACFPFDIKGNDGEDMMNILPPLIVPNFRYWKSQTFVPDNEAQIATEEKMVVETGSDDIHAFMAPHQNVGEENGILVLHSKENTDIGDIKAGNSSDTSGVNPLQIIERLDNTTTDASDALPLCLVDNPDTTELGNDGVLSAIPPRRKPKLRSLADIMGTEKSPTSEMEALLSPQAEKDVAVVPVDVAKDAAIPERKRKIDLGEDDGPLKAICRKAGKRIKGLNIDAGKRVEVLDSESEGDAAMRSDLKMDARIEPKKAKALTNIKKMRQKLHKEDRTVPMKKSSANLQKNGLPVEINFGNKSKSGSGIAPSIMEEMGPFFRCSEKSGNLSKNKMPQAGSGSDHNPIVYPRKSNLGDSSSVKVKGKAVLDLSLDSFFEAENDKARRRGIIPDLNEEPLEGNPLNSVLDRSFPLHKTLDGATSEGNKEVEASDDIPMDIVELLAKNQRERAFESSRYLLGVNNNNNSNRGYSPLCVDGRPGPSMIEYRNSGLSMRNGSLGARQNTPQLNSYRLETNRTENSLLWSSSARENAPFHLNMAPPKQPQHSLQTNSTCVDSFLNRAHKGKTVTDGAGTSISSSLGSLDPYSSNDTIPAMQLLSLMDQRVQVRSSFKVGAKSAFLGKSSFAPGASSSNPHPCVNEKKQSFHNRKLFPQNSSKKASGTLRAQLGQELGNLGVCTLNRNPGDFSYPHARNEFTISGRDLKLIKWGEKAQMENGESSKKGRPRMRN